MAQLAVSALGADRPGIVAAITGVLVGHRLNIADSQMGILSGRFSAVLIVEGGDEADVAALQRDLREVADRLDLDAIHVHAVGEASDSAGEPTHIVTVYGVDHPGIVHAVAHELGARGANITDLNTRRIAGDGGEPLYAMMIEVAVPSDADGLVAALDGVGSRQGVEVTVREIEADAF